VESGREVHLPPKSLRSTRASARSRAYRLHEYRASRLRNGFSGDSSDIERVRDFLSVERANRYRPDNATYCNVYASDFCCLLGAYLPRVWWNEGQVPPGGEAYDVSLGKTVHEMRANKLHDWMSDFGPRYGWVRRACLQEAYRYVNKGHVGIVTAKSSVGVGHIAVIMPSLVEGEPILQSEAGRRRTGGADLGEWWADPKFSEFGFWTNACPSRVRKEVVIPTPSGPLARLIEWLFPTETAAIYERLQETGESTVPPILIEALIIAEDRRYLTHKGFDLRAICRAICSLISQRGLQGASTIEQQFVRTVTDHRRRTIRRKLREIVLANWCSNRFSKEAIAASYLTIAYYGKSATGLAQVLRRLDADPHFLNIEEAATVVTALRYPLTDIQSEAQNARFARRRNFVIRGLMRGINTAKPTVASGESKLSDQMHLPQ
jgi:hypothetical protein